MAKHNEIPDMSAPEYQYSECDDYTRRPAWVGCMMLLAAFMLGALTAWLMMRAGIAWPGAFLGGLVMFLLPGSVR